MTPMKRYRLSVPVADEATVQWCAAQSNLSFSLRVMIRDYIARNGITDATCGELLSPPKRGRPAKEEAVAPVITQPTAPVRQSVQPSVPARKPAPRDADGFVDPSDIL